MPRCYAAMGILGGVSKMCYLVEDSLRHLRCRGMTSQGFPLEMPILTSFGGMTREIQNYDDKIVVSSSRLGRVQASLTLLSLTRNFTLFFIFFIPCYCPLSNQKYQKISLKKGHFTTE